MTEDDAPTDLLTSEVVHVTAESVPFVVRVMEGPDVGAHLVLDVPGQRALVGVSTVCDLRLTDRRVSRRHLAIESSGDALRVCDLASTNGTFAQTVRVVEALLSEGERLRIGDTVLGVERAAAPVRRVESRATSFGRLIGASAAMRAIYPLCERLAQSNLPVVIEGETGTGKEVLAEALHEASPRAKCPFVVFDCTAVAPSILESELFGHERGAFTGAIASRAGVFEQADGGTLLIDEIGDLDLALQPKLLRAIERSEVRRVGGQKATRVDVRILAATRRDLDHEVLRGRFRDDLFHRLAVARVELPPLRDRHGDVSILVRHFVAELGAAANAVPYEQMLRWQDSQWPGNVRELRNAVARCIALGDLANDTSTPSSSAAVAPGVYGALLDLPIGLARQRLVEEFEKVYVERVLAAHGGDVERAAAASGIARRQFFRLKAKATGGGGAP